MRHFTNKVLDLVTGKLEDIVPVEREAAKVLYLESGQIEIEDNEKGDEHG